MKIDEKNVDNIIAEKGNGLSDSVMSISLADMVDVEALQEIQDCFSKTTKFGAVISDNLGNPITKYSMFSPICQIIRNHPEGVIRCQKSDEALGRHTDDDKDVSFHYCHAGLLDLAAPIVVNDSHLGTVLCGQVLCDSFDLEEARERFDKCIDDLGLDRKKMEEYYDKVPVVTYERVKEVADLLQVISSHVVELGINRINQSIINEINMSIVEEQKARSELEQSLKLSELKSLESTVNPHFLFNALNTIARLALMEDAPRTEEMAYTLAELLRYNLRNVGNCVPFRDEIQYSNKYIQVQKTRFKDRFDIKVDVTEEAMDAMVPAMTLQPLLENTLLHGLKDCLSGGEINIEAKVENDVFILQVTDNGEGIEPEKLAPIKEMLQNKGITDSKNMWMGLSNVCRQLHYFFDSNCAMDVVSEPGVETRVTITAYEPANIEKGGTL